MRIRSIESYPLVLPVREIYGGAAGFLEDCRTLIIRLEAEDGIEGWGEATQGRPANTYETLETMDIMVRRYFAPAITGMELEDNAAVVQKLRGVRYGHPSAKAAIETAVLDALGKLHRVPLCRLLGGPHRREIDLVGGLGLDLGSESIAAHASELREQGFKIFKIKIGQKDRRKDIERVRAVREAVGEDCLIRVDGNGCYSFFEAREILNALAPLGITDAEQPLGRADHKSLAELRRTASIPIAVQESVSSPEDAHSVLAADAADLLKIKLTHIGGYEMGLATAAVFAARNLPVIIGQGSACTSILSSAEMHLHASLRNAQRGGEMTGFLRLGKQEIFSPIEVKAAQAKLPDAPGLGVEVALDRLRQMASAQGSPGPRTT